MGNDYIVFLSEIVILLIVDVCESAIKATNVLSALSMAENSSNCICQSAQTLSGIFPRHTSIHAHLSKPALVESFAKFRRGKSI